MMIFVASACGPQPRRLEFDDLRAADRIDVTDGVTRLATITDKSKIQDAVAFIEQYHDGWIDVWSGAGAARLLVFYKGSQALGLFGMSPDNLTVGNLLRKTPAAEITALAERLGIPWPPPDPRARRP